MSYFWRPSAACPQNQNSAAGDKPPDNLPPGQWLFNDLFRNKVPLPLRILLWFLYTGHAAPPNFGSAAKKPAPLWKADSAFHNQMDGAKACAFYRKQKCASRKLYYTVLRGNAQPETMGKRQDCLGRGLWGFFVGDGGFREKHSGN